MTTIPQPILAFFESSNRGDPAAVVACFTPNAVLDDWGRHFEGHKGVASCDRTDNTGVQAHIEPVSARAAGDTLVVTVKVRGNGFNGTGHMHSSSIATRSRSSTSSELTRAYLLSLAALSIPEGAAEDALGTTSRSQQGLTLGHEGGEGICKVRMPA